MEKQRKKKTTLEEVQIDPWIAKLTPYKLLIKPVLTVWLWIMPLKSILSDSLGHFYISTVLSILLTAAVWYHEKVYAWAESYIGPFLYPKKKPEKLYDLAVQIFHFSLYFGMALAIMFGLALLSKAAFI